MRNGWIFGLLAMAMGLTGCLKDDCTRTVTYMKQVPVYMQPGEFRDGIQMGEARSLEQPGKIYVYEDYLLVNEMRKGIHVYDNSNPSTPVKIGFLKIPGNIDMAVRNGYLYADNATDLVAIDIRSGIEKAEVVDREELAFQPISENSEKGILIHYETEEVTEEVPCGSMLRNGISWPLATFDNMAMGVAESGNSSGSNTGLGGSMARFSLMKDHLYVIDQSDMWTYETLENGQLEFQSNVQVEWGIETLFGYGDYLFIGANNGMHIMDNTNPDQPVHLASYAHATACDPVFVSGNYAYVTLRDGTDCQNFTNQLDVVSIEDIEDPKLMESFQMEHPHGLSVNSDVLYLCEGRFGMKSFDASDPLLVGDRRLHRVDGFDAYDVIVNRPDHMIVTGTDGIFQFAMEPESGSFEQISEISIK